MHDTTNLDWNNVGARERYDDMRTHEDSEERAYDELRLKASLKPKSIRALWQERARFVPKCAGQKE